ncbi:uncharacterized protein LODBEIA_P29490 [Lodderomyces beijingensis]|uniref:Mitotic check point protein BFA1 n=1 Tax=Lodderomyces beijingensis TaxID=1775926 RepID=A0ABP0ZKQ1_9ASCO
MRPSKADLLEQFADSQEDEIFGDLEYVDFKSRSPATKAKTVRRADDVTETLKVNELNLNSNNSPSFQLTPRSGAESPSKSTKSSGRRVTRDALSEYSEENDTDITSEFSQDDFEGWDDCFSKDQSGSIYQQMNQRLIARKIAEQKEAEREQQELIQMNQMRNNHRLLFKESPNQTLVLKDPSRLLTNENLSLLDQLENERTINYEYTRDDVEQFEDGFDDDFEQSIHKFQAQRKVGKLQAPGQRSQSSYEIGQLQNKQSMPSLPRANHAAMKKYRSTLDFHGRQSMDSSQALGPPQFNYNNRVINRLDRIPSFYNKPPVDFENRNQILYRFKESKAPSHHKHPNTQSKRMGHVRYLNNGGSPNADIPVQQHKSMRFNKQKSVWEGNEVDLLRFEKRPSLITHKDIQPRVNPSGSGSGTEKGSASGSGLSRRKQGNMLYDEEKLKWINLEEEAEEELIFDDIPDLDEGIATIRQSNLPQPVSPRRRVPVEHQDLDFLLQSPVSRRGLSQFTQRTTSTATVATEGTQGTQGTQKASSCGAQGERSEFKVSSKLVDKFVKEEQKIDRKISHWFIGNSDVKRDYYWEIRRMVTEDK